MDDIGRFADTAGEKLGLFEDRCANFLKAVTAKTLARHVLDAVPERHVRRQNIPCPSYSLNHKVYMRFRSSAVGLFALRLFREAEDGLDSEMAGSVCRVEPQIVT